MSGLKQNQKRYKRHVVFDEKTGISLAYTKKKDGTIICECLMDVMDAFQFLETHPEFYHEFFKRAKEVEERV